MPLLSAYRDPRDLNDRLSDAHAATAELMTEIICGTCRRFPSIGQTEKTARIEQLIHSQAWTDAALALIDLELPHWQVRRIAYDEGEAVTRTCRWRFCARSSTPSASARLKAGQASLPCVVAQI